MAGEVTTAPTVEAPNPSVAARPAEAGVRPDANKGLVQRLREKLSGKRAIEALAIEPISPSVAADSVPVEAQSEVDVNAMSAKESVSPIVVDQPITENGQTAPGASTSAVGENVEPSASLVPSAEEGSSGASGTSGPTGSEASGPDVNQPLEQVQPPTEGQRAFKEITEDLGLEVTKDSRIGDLLQELGKKGWKTDDPTTQNYAQAAIDQAKAKGKQADGQPQNDGTIAQSPDAAQPTVEPLQSQETPQQLEQRIRQEVSAEFDTKLEAINRASDEKFNKLIERLDRSDANNVKMAKEFMKAMKHADYRETAYGIIAGIIAAILAESVTAVKDDVLKT